MKTSQDGINLIKKFEGCFLKAYKCPAGVWTIGYGHTNNVRPDDMITELQANELLKVDVRGAELTVSTLVKQPLTQNQFDALVSFVYNVGAANFKKSTLLKKINAGDFLGAANEFPKWVYAKKKKLSGLVQRRNGEKEFFMKMD